MPESRPAASTITRSARVTSPPLHSTPRPSARARVADQQGAEQGEHREPGVDGGALEGEAVGDGGEEDPFRDAVEGRIEKCAERRCHLRQSGQDAVEQVQDPGHQIDHAGQDRLVGDDQTRRQEVEQDARHRDLVGAYMEAQQATGERRKGGLAVDVTVFSDTFHCRYEP